MSVPVRWRPPLGRGLSCPLCPFGSGQSRTLGLEPSWRPPAARTHLPRWDTTAGGKATETWLLELSGVPGMGERDRVARQVADHRKCGRPRLALPGWGEAQPEKAAERRPPPARRIRSERRRRSAPAWPHFSREPLAQPPQPSPAFAAAARTHQAGEALCLLTG